eukprot:scaffold166843_cov35-Prasinocladus_malaysianus.AAC.1
MVFSQGQQTTIQSSMTGGMSQSSYSGFGKNGRGISSPSGIAYLSFVDVSHSAAQQSLSVGIAKLGMHVKLPLHAVDNQLLLALQLLLEPDLLPAKLRDAVAEAVNLMHRPHPNNYSHPVKVSLITQSGAHRPRHTYGIRYVCQTNSRAGCVINSLPPAAAG